MPDILRGIRSCSPGQALERMHRPTLPRDGRLGFLPCHLRCPIRHFFWSGHGPTAMIAHQPLPINTPSLGWAARLTWLGTHFVNRKAALSELPKTCTHYRCLGLNTGQADALDRISESNANYSCVSGAFAQSAAIPHP